MRCDLSHCADITEVATGAHAYIRMLAAMTDQDPDSEACLPARQVALVSPDGVMFQGARPEILDPAKGRPGFGEFVEGAWALTWEAGSTGVSGAICWGSWFPAGARSRRAPGLSRLSCSTTAPSGTRQINR